VKSKLRVSKLAGLFLAGSMVTGQAMAQSASTDLSSTITIQAALTVSCSNGGVLDFGTIILTVPEIGVGGSTVRIFAQQGEDGQVGTSNASLAVFGTASSGALACTLTSSGGNNNYTLALSGGGTGGTADFRDVSLTAAGKAPLDGSIFFDSASVLTGSFSGGTATVYVGGSVVIPQGFDIEDAGTYVSEPVTLTVTSP
jgi:hypothetical protein